MKNNLFEICLACAVFSLIGIIFYIGLEELKIKREIVAKGGNPYVLLIK